MIMNRNPRTGVPYGVASLNSLADWVFDEFFNDGTNESYDEAWKEFKAQNPDMGEDEAQDQFNDEYEGYEENYTLECDGMRLGLSYLGGAALVWVFDSKHTARVRQCSPCVPGAGDLNNPDPDGMECYTLPPAWFDEDEQ